MDKLTTAAAAATTTMDDFQTLLAIEYQRQQLPAATHYHECSECGVTLVCCCLDRRQVDRLTGKPRRLLCVACGDRQLEAT